MTKSGHSRLEEKANPNKCRKIIFKLNSNILAWYRRRAENWLETAISGYRERDGEREMD